ncbi:MULTISPECIES: sugar phosphate isomerase/epimerase family protein [Methanosphaera]|uniref:Predicted sugar phosphate isomerase/epimerase or endonuclease n=2 Tax=Methanosphaera stadtmanae TaxID=2317 RepID=Q2NGK4_METST|nr:MULTISPECIES: sugar phosphate isomerase/epimerase family protein [Methanosphaera]ABC57049.1 predicted sugar phosphate isomerase/epimerase or endonuclease [Methanosphaera stadtmanae DSM 3091]MEE0489632.1 sugar phosphate isomerase/epimerase family protein [Methanosphaera stadtmanae]OEC91022.1 sugar phosphate isomerase [Methanosphaera sp. A6]RAP03333.1 sugar phosphate isomerase [Methanosphaera stadtmanae]RAP47845.1 MAG: sugar phosphate isomerase [Methanosphaera sp. DEW79]
MKISVSTLGLYPATMENILDFVTEQKLDYLEVIKEYPYDEVGADVFESYDLGLSIHAPMSDVNIASHVKKIRDISVELMVDSFKLANDWGAERVVVHPGTIPIMALKYPEKILKYNVESLIKCQRAAQEYGVMMCVENMPLFERMLYTNVDALFDLVDNEIHSGITLDVGHAHNNGFAPENMFKSDNIHHIHLSDNDGSYDMHHALGSHNIDFPKIFDILKQKKYDDICVIEVRTLQGILKSIDYLKDINIL